MNKEVAFSTMVENIPDTARSSPALYGYFDKLFPGKVGAELANQITSHKSLQGGRPFKSLGSLIQAGWLIMSLNSNHFKGAGQWNHLSLLTQTTSKGLVLHLTQITSRGPANQIA